MASGDAFFELHRDLPREGPGDRASLDWALGHLVLPAEARILDAGCGPGADIDGLLAAAPRGRVVAVDRHAPFVARVRDQFAADPRVMARQGDMARVEGPFDLVWCAGALYFLGLEAGLAHFRSILAPGGHLVVSHPAWFTPDPSAAAAAFWEEELALVMTLSELETAVERAGFDVHALRALPDEAWHSYYTPMKHRIAVLRRGADPQLAAVLDEGQHEADTWYEVRRETGYAQVVASRR
ncbi:MAG: class I SAM-dependent methyltransferase [Myxococcota bacterium]